MRFEKMRGDRQLCFRDSFASMKHERLISSVKIFKKIPEYPDLLLLEYKKKTRSILMQTLINTPLFRISLFNMYLIVHSPMRFWNIHRLSTYNNYECNHVHCIRNMNIFVLILYRVNGAKYKHKVNWTKRKTETCDIK